MKRSRLLMLLLALCLILSTVTVIAWADDSAMFAKKALTGDANDDGIVDTRDVIMMRRYLADLDYDTGSSSIDIGSKADMNNDGEVRLRDLYLLRYYIVNDEYDTDETTSDIGDEYFPSVSKKNYDEEFYMSVQLDVNPMRYYWTESSDGGDIDEALYARQEQVRKYLGVEIYAYNAGSHTTYADSFKTAVHNKDGSVHLLLSHVNSGVDSLVSGGYLADFNDIKSIDLDANYWNREFMDELAINDMMFLGYSDFNALYTYVIAYNQDMMEQYGDYILGESVYDVVTDYRWTLDKMISLASLVQVDKTGDGKTEDDTFGLTGVQWVPFVGFLEASDIQLVDLVEDGSYRLSFGNSANLDKTTALVSKLSDLAKADYAWFRYRIDDTPEVNLQSGRSLMELKSTLSIFVLHDYDLNFGVLPYPMYNEAQKDVGYRHLQWGGYLCVPAWLSNPQMVGDTIEMLSYYSAGVNSAFINKITDEPNDAEMLEIVWDSVCSDFGQAYSNVVGALYMMPELTHRDDITVYSYFNDIERSANKSIKKLVVTTINSYGGFDDDNTETEVPETTETDLPETTETEIETKPEVEDSFWTVYGRASQYDPDSDDDNNTSVPGYEYTDDGFHMTPADWSTATPWGQLSTTAKVSLKDGVYMQVRVDDFSYDASDKWFNLYIWSENKIDEGSADPRWGHGVQTLIRPNTSTDPEVPGKLRSIAWYIEEFTNAGSSTIDEANTAPVDGKNVLTLEVKWENDSYVVIINGSLAPEKVITYMNETFGFDDSAYIGFAMHNYKLGGTLEATVTKFGTSADDAATPVGDAYKAPENYTNEVAEIADPSTVPLGQPAIFMTGDRIESDLKGTPKSTTGSFISITEDYKVHVVAIRSVADAGVWKVDNDVSYDIKDFPVAVCVTKNFCTCDMDGECFAFETASVYMMSGEYTSPSPKMWITNIDMCYDPYVIGDDSYLYFYVDMAAEKEGIEGRIHGARFDFSDIDLATPGANAFDVEFIAFFRTVGEMEAYMENYFVSLGWSEE